MTDLEILEQMIKAAARVATTVGNGKASVTLDEPQSPDSSVIISGLPSDAIVMKVDAFQSPDAIFCGSKGECKRADYVIVTDSGTKKRIIYRCQPWRAKRRLVVPSSREAALFSRRALRQRENKVGLRTRRPVIWEPSTEQQRACEVVA